MVATSSSIQLVWSDPATEVEQQFISQLPIALGRDAAEMMKQGQLSSAEQALVLPSSQISRVHALLTLDQEQVKLTDQGSRNGVYVNGQPQTTTVLQDGDTFQIGPYEFTLILSNWASRLVIAPTAAPVAVPQDRFPPPAFLQAHRVSPAEITQLGIPVLECDYAAVGGGLGSYIWVDYLRIFGARLDQIRVVGKRQLDAQGYLWPDAAQKPYWNYKQLCGFSQIPLHERLRSNSDSCPDNIWGWPSYALREAWYELIAGQPAQALRYLWQVFAEPDFIETYTPRAGRVFDSIDREMERIGWGQMFRYGDVRAIRQTTDDRYAIAYSRSSRAGRAYEVLIAPYVHLAVGYPAIKVLPQVATYREQTQEPIDQARVVNAYESHDHVYQVLTRRPQSRVILQGRGIVASRIIQRLYELRLQHRLDLELVHLMRSPRQSGHRFGGAQREVKFHQELQPFNWPKACWGGDLRIVLESADPQRRQALLSDWGGTTTADRQDWQQILAEGFSRWYQITFGEIERLQPQGEKLSVTYIKVSEGQRLGPVTLEADFLIDATGLINDLSSSPLLADLVDHYQLRASPQGVLDPTQVKINPFGRLSVADDFRVEGMDNGRGRMYAAGAMTLGGPYAAVDSFLGLQYAALQTMDALVGHRAPGLTRLNGLQSLGQWWKWVRKQAP